MRKTPMRRMFVAGLILALSAAAAHAQTPTAISERPKPELVVQTGHRSSVDSIAFSSNGRLLASGSEDHTVKLWDVATGRELRTLAGHTDRVLSVIFSPDGRTLASGSDDKSVKLWDLATGREFHR